MIFVNGSLEANYLSSRVRSIRQILASMVRYLGDGSPEPFGLSAPTGVYGVMRYSPASDPLLWLLAPVGFKDAAVGRMRQEFIPVANVEVRIRIPEGKKAKALWLKRSGKKLPFRTDGGYEAATLPSLHIAELVHLET